MIKRSGDYYHAALVIDSMNVYNFNNTSERIQEIIERTRETYSTKTIWQSTSFYGTGYFFREGNDKASIVIGINGTNYEAERAVCMGFGGAYPRRFNKEDLEVDLGELGVRATQLVHACLDNEVLEEFKDRGIFLSG